MAGTGTASAVLDAPADAVFGTLTDLAALPEWNTRMTEVTETPTTLEPGAEWVVRFRAMGQTWLSRSRVGTYDPTTRRFADQSMTDDGNPSRALWTWQVDEVPEGAKVTLSWELRPATFWRRVLLSKIRAKQLGEEVPASLAALERVASKRPV